MISVPQIRLVQSTWQQILPIREQVAELFYARLFELDPSMRRLFKADIAEQGRKLAAMITAAVSGLDELDELVPAVQALGRRHAVYGVTDAHYDTVGSALLWTLEQCLGASFTPVAREAWTRTYVLLANTMKEAGAGSAA